jgi:hypothetical protein
VIVTVGVWVLVHTGVGVAVTVEVKDGTAVLLGIGLGEGVVVSVAEPTVAVISTCKAAWLGIGFAVLLQDTDVNRIIVVVHATSIFPHEEHMEGNGALPYALRRFSLLFTLSAGDLLKLGLAEGCQA